MNQATLMACAARTSTMAGRNTMSRVAADGVEKSSCIGPWASGIDVVHVSPREWDRLAPRAKSYGASVKQGIGVYPQTGGAWMTIAVGSDECIAVLDRERA